MSGHGKRPEDSGPRREVEVTDEREVADGPAGEGDDQATASFERKHDPSRVVALSDGVFAIIITRLVLEIHVPEFSKSQPLAQGLETRPSFVAFVISFIVAGMYWVGHRDVFG
jgi:hypothetical protein